MGFPHIPQRKVWKYQKVAIRYILFGKPRVTHISVCNATVDQAHARAYRFIENAFGDEDDFELVEIYIARRS